MAALAAAADDAIGTDRRRGLLTACDPELHSPHNLVSLAIDVASTGVIGIGDERKRLPLTIVRDV